MMAAAMGPKVKPPMQTATCLKSKSRNITGGISLDIQAMMTETPEIEDESARRLNTPEQYERFRAWTELFNG